MIILICVGGNVYFGLRNDLLWSSVAAVKVDQCLKVMA